MSNPLWTKLSYTANSQIPLLGEVILLRYPIGIIPFSYGPASKLATSANTSRAYTTFSTTSTGKPKRLKASFHHVLVVRVTHDPTTTSVHLQFLPILSYSSRPPGFTLPLGASSWVAAEWMAQATEVQRLHHLPVPAIGWNPPRSHRQEVPVLSFGSWFNTRPSWLAMTIVEHSLLENHQWCRHPAGPVIVSGDVSNLILFIFTDIPRLIHDLSTTVNNVTLPTYHNVWANIYSNHPFSCHPDDDDESDAGTATSTEIARALKGDDGIDPVSFWGFPGAPAPLFALAKEQARKLFVQKILEWEEQCEDAGNAVGEVDGELQDGVLDVRNVGCGETAWVEK